MPTPEEVNVLTIGLHPDVPGPVSAADLLAHLKQAETTLAEHGFAMDSCFVLNAASDEATLEAALRAKRYACVCVGGGLRFAPQYTELFEKVINLVHRSAPEASFCFNTTLTDIAAAIQRAC